MNVFFRVQKVCILFRNGISPRSYCLNLLCLESELWSISSMVRILFWMCWGNGFLHCLWMNNLITNPITFFSLDLLTWNDCVVLQLQQKVTCLMDLIKIDFHGKTEKWCMQRDTVVRLPYTRCILFNQQFKLMSPRWTKSSIGPFYPDRPHILI
jgi:hypothetical protein